ncbi:MAG: adenylate/guanylate cyclase domain-containing protein [Actinobacteria bacterium]|nr:MAG: adenylate/guanylate cyclase domain-containing protein [Actinomycetota bacterium]
MQPETQYAKSGNVNIAYQVVGEGPPDLVAVDVISHIELDWEVPSRARFLNRLASICRLLRANQRGTGMSDREAGIPTLEMRMDDIRAVLDAVGSERAVLFGLGDAAPLSVLFAATYPERTSGLILMNASPRFVKSPSLPWLPTRGESQRQADDFERRWGDTAFAYEFIGKANPSATEEERRSVARVFRLSVSPGAASAYIRMNIDVDVCDVLPLIRVPTLVMHRKDVGAWDIRSGRYLADHIPGARFVELPGADFSPASGDQEELFAELETFLADVVTGKHAGIEPDRVLATVLFSDIVGSTEKAASLGDRSWRELLQRHHELVRRELERFRGQEVDTAGDGFFASFDGPARAIRCGCAISEAIPELGLEVRIGLHTGECELVEGKVAGIAVHTGARVAAMAKPGEVLVSSTVKDLVAGSGLAFEDRGRHELKGIPGAWHLYAVQQ